MLRNKGEILEHVFEIVRKSPQGTIESLADGGTTLQPGDILKIERGGSLPEPVGQTQASNGLR